MSHQSRYSLNDTVVFKYMNRNRWGTVCKIHMDKDLKNQIRFKYSIKELSPDIEIDERNVYGKVSGVING